ncbi:helix-turn-helix domain-containing protein [Pseudarthrobacter sp. MEB009]|uniref:winged helix-turn-helix transcriptional regulator n=2 Tax=Micrococcaceae TaxID=1268 RepID=UPI003305BD49
MHDNFHVFISAYYASVTSSALMVNLCMTFCASNFPGCGVARFLGLMNGPWATLIVRELLGGPLRFGEIKDRLTGISAHTLTNSLRKFEDHGLLTRTVYPEIPPRVVYELTPAGQELRTVLNSMNDWALSVPMVAQMPDSTHAL